MYCITSLDNKYAVVYLEPDNCVIVAQEPSTGVWYPMNGKKVWTVDGVVMEDIVSFTIPEVDDGNIPRGMYRGINVIIHE